MELALVLELIYTFFVKIGLRLAWFSHGQEIVRDRNTGEALNVVPVLDSMDNRRIHGNGDR